MLSLASYLELSLPDAREQWRAIAARSAVSVGQRQVDFLPIETLLCYGLGLIGHSSTSGTVNILSSSPEVQLFSHLFRRTSKSLAAKLNNLDGRRPHAAKFEQSLWIELTSHRATYAVLYEVIIAGARAIGLGPGLVPDFLGHDDHRLDIVFDAVTISDSDLFESVEPAIELATAADPMLNLAMTERALIGTARVGQQQFARQVLTNAGFHCVFCGLSTRAHAIPSSRMLVASHIKPWRESTGGERVDPLNGLAACPTHDAAFENYLIAVDDYGGIVRSSALQHAVASDPVWARYFGPNALAPSLLMPKTSPPPGLGYVDWHRAHLVVEVPPQARHG